MITERQQEQASLFVLGALSSAEEAAFARELADNPPLQELVNTLRKTADLLLQAVPPHQPPGELKRRILQRLGPTAAPGATARPAPPGFAFIEAADAGWKPLPVEGAWVKLLSADQASGYVVLLGKLEAGRRYPPHTHAGSEDLYLLTGDLHVGSYVLGPGDFHHSDAGTTHEENYSVNGCTLLAIVSKEHALAKFALASLA
jgi:anti-sigma factor ChrR (cupin superfamily)